jgi:sugar O-acyltransferase (sialic acid O-acetyltransferase NeuD family)
LGSGGHGRVVADAAYECGYSEIAFLDDSPGTHIVKDVKVLGPMSSAARQIDHWPEAIAAVGNGELRLSLFGKLQRLGFRTPNVVHPSAVVSRGASFGEGVFVAAGAIVNVGVQIGNAVIVNTGAKIDHDCRIGDGVHIAPGATLSGTVIVADMAWLGTGCAVRQGISIGSKVVVGVGAAVVSDLLVGQVYSGVPARPMKKID